ncbi:hypothetical protein [Dokdonia sp. Hel_I_53]|uniref:hypothetical protein n=1 Tax=Dokdonia sp. Hel_I_53 TaxID=1566287 RepID=UPI001199B350|nr:hypothetical protein [Dokdonia sp. Hel_I_53]TVZ52183.1 hypothetical protein OD90_1353 [Dokdonia sp. Hel_I_53]
MKTIIKFVHLMILTLCVSCGGGVNYDGFTTNDDGGIDELTLVETWDTSSGTLSGQAQNEYLILEEDNTLEGCSAYSIAFNDANFWTNASPHTSGKQ